MGSMDLGGKKTEEESTTVGPDSTSSVAHSNDDVVPLSGVGGIEEPSDLTVLVNPTGQKGKGKGKVMGKNVTVDMRGSQGQPLNGGGKYLASLDTRSSSSVKPKKTSKVAPEEVVELVDQESSGPRLSRPKSEKTLPVEYTNRKHGRSHSTGDISALADGRDSQGKSAWERLRVRMGAVQQLRRLRKADNELKFLTSNGNLGTEIRETSKRPCYMVHPHGRFRFIWDFIIILMLLYSAFMIPLRVGFGFDSSFPDFLYFFEILIDAYFFLDIVLNFLTGRLIFEEGEDPSVDYRQPRVAVKYLRTWFIVDLAATIPINLFLDDSSFVNELPRLLRIPRIIKFVRLFRLLKMARLLRMNVLVHRWSEIVSLNPAVTRVVKLFGGIIFVAHFLGCLFYFAAYLEDLGPHTWIFKYLWGIYACDGSQPGRSEEDGIPLRITELNLTRGDCIDELSASDIALMPLGTTYIMSLYWSFATLSTIGYGDISAITDVEYIINVIGMCVGVTLYAYIVGNISSLLAHIDTQKTIYQDHMRTLNEFLRKKKLPKPLRRRIRRYFQHYYMKKASPVSEEKLLSDITLPGLRHETVHALYADVISKVPFFDDKDPQFVSMTVTKLSSIKCPAADYILREGEIPSEMYFVAKGSVNVVDSRNKIIYKRLNAGEVFGEVAMLTSTRHIVSYKADSDVELYALTREDLFRVLQEFPSLSVVMHHEASEKLRVLRKRVAFHSQQKSAAIEDQPFTLVPPQVREMRRRSLSDTFGMQLAVLDEMYQKQGEQAQNAKDEPTVATLLRRVQTSPGPAALQTVQETGGEEEKSNKGLESVDEHTISHQSVGVPRPPSLTTGHSPMHGGGGGGGGGSGYIEGPPTPVFSRMNTLQNDRILREVFCPHCGSVAFVKDGTQYFLGEEQQ